MDADPLIDLECDIYLLMKVGMALNVTYKVESLGRVHSATSGAFCATSNIAH